MAAKKTEEQKAEEAAAAEEELTAEKVRARSRELDAPGKTGWFKAHDGRNRPITLMVPGERKVHLNELRVRSVKDGSIVGLVDGLNMKNGQPEFRREQLMASLARRDKHFDVPIYVVDEPVEAIKGVRYGGDVPVRNDAWDRARLYYAKERAKADRKFRQHVDQEKARIKNQLALDAEGLAPTLPSADILA